MKRPSVRESTLIKQREKEKKKERAGFDQKSVRDKEPDTVRNRDKEREKLTFILTGSLALDSIVDPDEATLTRVAGHVAEILTEVVVTRRTPRETGTICHRVVKRSFVPLQITFMAICN